MKEYFYKPEYKYMYLANVSYSFANALSETFGTVNKNLTWSQMFAMLSVISPMLDMNLSLRSLK